MTPTQKTQLAQSKRRERLGELLAVEKRSDDEAAEMQRISETDMPAGEIELRAAISFESANPSTATADPSKGVVAGASGEDPARVELRSRASLTNFMTAVVSGRTLSGAEAELASEMGLGTGFVPLEMLNGPARKVEHRADALSPSATPGTVGINMQTIVPDIFARSVAPRLGIMMPRVPSGTYAVPRISTSLSAVAKARNAAGESTSAAFTYGTTTPHRVTARLSIAIEDAAAIGTSSFEASLRQNLSLALSDQLDEYALRAGSGDVPNGLLGSLADPTDPTDVVTWGGFVSAVAGGIDGGPWAESLRDVRLLTTADTMRLAEVTFQKGSGTDTPRRGERRGLPADAQRRVFLIESDACYSEQHRSGDPISARHARPRRGERHDYGGLSRMVRAGDRRPLYRLCIRRATPHLACPGR